MEKKQHAALPTDLKIKNRKNILRYFQQKKRCSVNDVSRDLGISRQTVTKALQYFMQINIIESVGKGESTDIGGKRPELFRLNIEKYIICISTYDKKMLFSLFTVAGESIDEAEIKYDFTMSAEQTGDLIAYYVKELFQNNQIPFQSLYGIVYGIGGVVDEDTKMVLFSSNSPQWGTKVFMKDLIESRLKADIIYEIRNIGQIASYSLIRYEELKHVRVAAIYCDYGISACYMENGKVINGSHALQGEIGHIVLDPSDEEICGCGDRGCFERLVSAKRVKQIIAEMPEEIKQELHQICDFDKDDIRPELMRAADNGNKAAQNIISQIAVYFSYIIKTIYYTFDPEYVVIEGVFAKYHLFFEKEIRKRLEHNRYLPKNGDMKLQFCSESLKELQVEGGKNVMLSRFFEDSSLYSE